ncbi:MAG: hypothetical protein GY821_17110 [Gammaproteobacteria bacterium]|nr:hypothetical protein [Gammaproteobacteria bacterium]
MAQFRITQKFATDYKIKILAEPKQTNNIFDDWVIDRLIVKRKKVAMITHVRTVYTWLIPYSSVGGVKNIPNVCDARHGTEFSGESPPGAELKRFTSLDKGKFVRACHEGRYHV